MARLGILCLKPAAAEEVVVTGLTFPINDSASVPRFNFSGADLIPMYPLTLVHRVYILQQTGYHTTFFWGNHETPFVANQDYFGCHPYPDGDPTAHHWEISAIGADKIVDVNANSTVVTKGRWYTQAVTAELIAGDVEVRFYYDIDAGLDHYIIQTIDAPAAPPTPGLFYGGNPWAPTTEHLGGHLRAIQQYDTKLSGANILAAAALNNDADVLALGLDPWYLNMNPTHTDIADQSGSGHHPAWVGADRPTTYTE
jgi:hypothetical protein